LERNLSNIGALALERRYIKWWGRHDIGTGILHNRTDGGDMGALGYKLSETAKRKISERQIGRVKTASERINIGISVRNRPLHVCAVCNRLIRSKPNLIRHQNSCGNGKRKRKPIGFAKPITPPLPLP
jgi:D-serine deaminase-like pyridoxal phosphate-dependent protein